MRCLQRELDARIEEVLVDVYGEDEQLGSFACVLDELLEGGVRALMLGEAVELVAVSDDGTMLGLRAESRRSDRTWEVALIDADLAPGADPGLDLVPRCVKLRALAVSTRTSMCTTLAAYRRWVCGR